jgi:hypothetical protein
MSETTFDPLPEVARDLLEKGEDVTLSDFSNVAPGTHGWAVHCLVRRGLWQEKQRHKRHIGDPPLYGWIRYGPCQTAAMTYRETWNTHLDRIEQELAGLDKLIADTEHRSVDTQRAYSHAVEQIRERVVKARLG